MCVALGLEACDTSCQQELGHKIKLASSSTRGTRTAVAYRKSKGTFLHGYERGVASVVLMRCWGTVERSRFVVLCNRSMRAWRPCCDAKSQILIRVPSGFFADETAGAWKPRFVFCQERSDSVRARRPYVSIVLCTEWRKCHTQGSGHPYRGSKWRILFNRSS